MTDDASETPPTAVESSTEATAESATVAEPDTKPVAEEASPPPASASEPLDPQLIVLCAVLWIVAMVIFGSNYQNLRVNWYLGNIKETLGPMPAPGTPAEQLPPGLSVDFEAIGSLVAMADDTDVVAAVAKELSNPAQRDQRYRVLLVVVVEQILGDASFDLLIKIARDADYRVRINSYRALTKRAKTASAEKRERVFGVLTQGLAYEPVARARSFAAEKIAEFKDTRANWPLIKALRDADGKGRLSVRGSSLTALRAINADLTEETLPFDLEASGAAFRDRVRSLEEWFTAGGGTIPPGESLDEQPEIDDEDDTEDGRAEESDAPPQDEAPDEATAPSDDKSERE